MQEKENLTKNCMIYHPIIFKAKKKSCASGKNQNYDITYLSSKKTFVESLYTLSY